MWATCQRPASSGYQAEFHEGCYQKHNNPLNCRTISGYNADFHEGHGSVREWQGHGMAGARHGMCELTRNGIAGARYGTCELTRHGMAGARHGMCELTRHGMAGTRHGRYMAWQGHGIAGARHGRGTAWQNTAWQRHGTFSANTKLSRLIYPFCYIFPPNLQPILLPFFAVCWTPTPGVVASHTTSSPTPPEIHR
jgi:hypothetical protein